MHFGICPISVVPIRTAASHKSEMASQLLFGEVVEVLEKKGRQWCKIRCTHDNLVGWVSRNQLKEITPTEWALYSDDYAFSLELVQAAMGQNHFVPITIGARLPSYDGIHFKLGDFRFTFSGQAVGVGESKANPDFILKMAKRYLNAPFLWGGRSPFGIDSSALVQVVFSLAGIELARDAADQIESGHSVDFVEQSQAGDLAFFENKVGRIAHVGIIMEDQKVIHSYGNVRIDKIDHYGIFNAELGRYTHKLRLCKRILPTEMKADTTVDQGSELSSQQVELF